MQAGETLEDRFHAITGRLNATHAELVDLTVEVLADPDIWGSWECRSVDRFVAWQGGLQISVARKVVQIARRASDLPVCVAAFREGLLSLDQLAPIAKWVPSWADEQICRQAQMMTVDQIQRTASKYPWDLDIAKPDGTTDGLERPEPVDDGDADHRATETDVAESDDQSCVSGGMINTVSTFPETSTRRPVRSSRTP